MLFLHLVSSLYWLISKTQSPFIPCFLAATSKPLISPVGHSCKVHQSLTTSLYLPGPSQTAARVSPLSQFYSGPSTAPFHTAARVSLLKGELDIRSCPPLHEVFLYCIRSDQSLTWLAGPAHLLQPSPGLVL